MAQDEVRGASHLFFAPFIFIGHPPLQVAAERHNEVCLLFRLTRLFLWDHAETFRYFFQVAVVHAVGQRAGAGPAGAACDMVNLGPSLPMCTATFVIAQVTVRVIGKNG